MALAILTIACFLFYTTSKYFPRQDLKIFRQNKKYTLLIAGALLLFSLVIFTFTSDFATSLVTWMVSFMMVMSAMILSVKLNFRWVWLWGAVSVLFILIDFV
ncbi:MAG: hypothetical protein AAFQ94_29085 [Bacteroidota bacterium]